MDATRNHYVQCISHTQKDKYSIFSCICEIQNFICICIYTCGSPNTRKGITGREEETLREGGNRDGNGI